VPSGEFSALDIDACLARYQCGGYLQLQWTRENRLEELPPVWYAALTRAHRKLTIDNLAALAEFRRLGRYLQEEGIPVLILKGADYLLDLYEDPSARFLTDIDLLVRPENAGRLARRLRDCGYETDLGSHYPEHCRFEMWRPVEGHCRFEIHWRLGLPLRARIDQAAVWERSRPGTLEEVPCRRLSVEDAVLFHAYHAADTYFGPSLKWVIDIREMFRRRSPNVEQLLEESATWGVRTALHLALFHLEKIFPGEAPAPLLAALRPGAFRWSLLRRHLLPDPVELMASEELEAAHRPVRLFLIDRPVDAFALSLRVLARPFIRPLQRALGGARPPWAWT
jgi:hypothetical protein